MLLAATSVGMLIGICVGIRQVKIYQRAQIKVAETQADWLMDIFNELGEIKFQIPNRYKNQNGEVGILYHKDEDK